MPDRMSSITLVTTTGQERITVSTYVKQTDTDRVIFESKLIPAETSTGDPAYKTPKGTLFTLKHLATPVVNDDNRHINSGDWKLRITGTGAEYTRLKTNMPTVTFGNTPPLVYLGSRQ